MDPITKHVFYSVSVFVQGDPISDTRSFQGDEAAAQDCYEQALREVRERNIRSIELHRSTSETLRMFER